ENECGLQHRIFAFEKADREHNAKRHQEEHEQHEPRIAQQPVSAFIAADTHWSRTTQLAAGNSTVTRAPWPASGRSRGGTWAIMRIPPQSTKISTLWPTSRTKVTSPCRRFSPSCSPARTLTSSGRTDTVTASPAVMCLGMVARIQCWSTRSMESPCTRACSWLLVPMKFATNVLRGLR